MVASMKREVVNPLEQALDIVSKQRENSFLWGPPKTALESLLQRELRILQTVIELLAPSEKENGR